MGIWGKNISGGGTACEKLRGRLALAAMTQARKEADLGRDLRQNWEKWSDERQILKVEPQDLENGHRM